MVKSVLDEKRSGGHPGLAGLAELVDRARGGGVGNRKGRGAAEDQAGTSCGGSESEGGDHIWPGKGG